MFQKLKIVKSGIHNDELVEIIEYIRVPKELSIFKPKLPKEADDGLNHLDHQ